MLRCIEIVSRPGQVVAEVGCGPGTYTRHLASRFSHVTALDPEQGMVDYMTTRMQREGHRNVVGAYGSVPDDLRAASGADGVVIVGVLDFAEDLTAWLRSLRSCVVPGGWVVFTVPFSRTAPRAAGAMEGLFAGRAFTRGMDEVHEAAAKAGLLGTQLAPVEHRGRVYTLVGSAVAP